MESIIIFGATGMTGLCALEAAVKKGLKVRAFVRDPEKVPAHLKDKIEVFVGNVLDQDAVTKALDGMDGAVILLGTRNCLDPTTDMSEGTKNVLKGMEAKNVKAVTACMSTFLLFQPEKVPPRFAGINDDHKRMLEALKASNVNWIAVLPPHIADECSGEMLISVNPETSIGRVIAKPLLAAFMVDALNEPKYYKAIVTIANNVNPVPTS